MLWKARNKTSDKTNTRPGVSQGQSVILCIKGKEQIIALKRHLNTCRLEARLTCRGTFFHSFEGVSAKASSPIKLFYFILEQPGEVAQRNKGFQQVSLRHKVVLTQEWLHQMRVLTTEPCRKEAMLALFMLENSKHWGFDLKEVVQE